MSDIVVTGDNSTQAIVTTATPTNIIVSGALQGVQGIQGVPGTPGAAGATGSKWYEGAGAPSVVRNDGDLYLNLTNGDIYQQAGGAWGTVIGNIKGPAGASGSNGAAGATGATGAAGAMTLYVAAATASAKIKAGADYVCDGTADNVEINAALAALPNGKGTVVLSSGDFSTTATISISANQRLKGNGVDSTRILGTANTYHVVHMGNRQASGTMSNNMALEDLTVSSIGGANSFDTVWVDGMGAGSHISNVKASEGRYNFRLTDLDQSYLQGIKASNSRVAGIYCEVGLENTWGNVQFYSVWPELSDANSTCILFDASAAQTSPNRFDRVAFYGGLLYATTGLTGTTGIKANVGIGSTKFVGLLSENNIDHVHLTGQSDIVWDSGSMIQNSGLSTNGFKLDTNPHKVTVISSRFQQMTNLFNGVSQYSNICLLGLSDNEGSISNLWTGQFGARYGTDTLFAGDGVLSSGGDNEHYSQVSAYAVNLAKGTTPNTATGRGAVYYSTSDGLLHFKNESGSDISLGSGGTTTTTTPTATSLYERGVAMSGLEFSPTVLPGTQGTDYFQVQDADVAYAAKKGFTFFRLPIQWERLQPTLGGALNSTYKGYIDNAIALARTYNMRIIIDVHNYGAYSVSGTLYKIGTTQVTVANFADLWTKIATAYASEPVVWGYDLMNEPHDMPTPTTSSNYNTTATWYTAANAAIAAIRAVDTKKWIMLETDNWSGLQDFTTNYGSNPTQWWTDSANRTMLSFHYYQDTDHSGVYVTAWSSTLRTRIPTDVTPALTWARSNDIKVYVGEFGVPNGFASDSVNWQTDMDTFLTYLDAYGAYASHWAMGQYYGGITTLEQNAGADREQMPILHKHLGYSPTNRAVQTGGDSMTGDLELQSKHALKLKNATNDASLSLYNNGGAAVSVLQADVPTAITDSLSLGSAGVSKRLKVYHGPNSTGNTTKTVDVWADYNNMYLTNNAGGHVVIDQGYARAGSLYIQENGGSYQAVEWWFDGAAQTGTGAHMLVPSGAPSMNIDLGDAAGVGKLKVNTSGGVPVWYVDSSGNVNAVGIITQNGIAVVTISGTQTLTNKTFDTANNTLKINGNALSGTPSGTTYLRGDGVWSTVTGGSATPGGSTTQIQYNNGGAFDGLSWLYVDTGSSPVNLVNTGTYKVISSGSNGFLFDNGSLAPAKNNWNLKCGSDGTFLFDQGGGLSGRLKLGGAGAGTYWDITPDYSNSYFKVTDGKVVTTANNTLDNGSGAATFKGPVTMNGATSGSTIIQPQATASGTLSLPAATDTLVGRATTDTLTNKSISGSANTITNIGNTALTNSAITIAGTSVSLGGTITQDTITGLAATGLVKRTAANTLAIATADTDYTTPTGTETLTNKRVTMRVSSATSSATPSVSTDSFDGMVLTAQAAAITTFTLSGTPTDQQRFLIRIKATGAFAITAPTNVSNSGVSTFPTTTVSGKTISAELIYDSTAAKWICMAVDATGY